MNIEELKTQANALGYNVSKKITYERLSPCKCGSKRIASEIGLLRGKYYRCTKCGFQGTPAKTKYQAIANWNADLRQSYNIKRCTVCLSFDRQFCETTTKEMAKQYNAVSYEITPVGTAKQHQIAYLGEIIMREDTQ